MSHGSWCWSVRRPKGGQNAALNAACGQGELDEYAVHLPSGVVGVPAIAPELEHAMTARRIPMTLTLARGFFYYGFGFRYAG